MSILIQLLLVTTRNRGFGGVGFSVFFGSAFTIYFTKVSGPSSTTTVTSAAA
jgi:hypothetical protein